MAATGKKLLIDFTGPQPRYEFTGDWTGKDVRVVLTHARRAYFLHNKSIRALDAASATQAVEASEEVTTPTVARKPVSRQRRK